MAIAELKTDLQSMQHYLFSLENVLSSSGYRDMLNHQYQFFVDRITSIGNINPLSAAELNSLISSGPWSASQQQALCTQIGNLVTVTVAATTGARKTQIMRTWNNYMTQPEVDKHRDTTYPTSEKLSLVANRMKICKFMWGSEASYKNVMVNWLHTSKFEAPLTSEDTYHLMTRLKSMIHQMRKGMPRDTSDHIVE